MLDSLFSRLAPHYCLSCGKIGVQICENCFYDIDLELRQTCFKCHSILSLQQCLSCDELKDVQQLILSERQGILLRLIDEYKFGAKREASMVMARLFDQYAPYFPADTQLVPIPTSSKHVRMRGFDHTHDFTKAFAALRKVSYMRALSRRHNHAQVGASLKQRQLQAKTAFTISVPLLKDNLYVVCDDVVTTGSSVGAAVELLRSAGVKNIAVLALLQQPWKNQG